MASFQAGRLGARGQRTKPAALGSAGQVGARAQGWGSARLLAHWQGRAQSSAPSRPAFWKVWGSHPRSAQLLCPRRRLGSVRGALRLAATWGTCWSLPAEAGRAARMQPVRIRTFRVRAAQPLLQGTAPASSLALPGDPVPKDHSFINTSEQVGRCKRCGRGHRERWLLRRFYRFHP